jgi:hypothetical protein
MEYELHDCGDESAYLPAENVVKSKFTEAPLLMKHVEVDWRRRELMDVRAVVSSISTVL